MSCRTFGLCSVAEVVFAVVVGVAVVVVAVVVVTRVNQTSNDTNLPVATPMQKLQSFINYFNISEIVLDVCTAIRQKTKKNKITKIY